MNPASKSFFLLLLFLLFGCKAKEDLSKAKKITQNKKVGILLENMVENEVSFPFLSFRATIDLKSPKQALSVTANFRMKHDSVIWVSISKLGIFAARAVFTADSVMMFNRLDNNYFIGDYAFFKKQFGVEINFKMLQAFLLSNPSALDLDEKSKVMIINDQYQISSIKPKKIVKELEKDKDKIDELAIILSLEPENFRPVNMNIYDFAYDQSVNLDYSDYVLVNERYLPGRLSILAGKHQEIALQAEFSKFEVDSSLTFPFKIPEKYTPLTFE